MDLADIAGIYFILQSIPGKGHAKVMTAGIGWAGAEILLTRFLLLWVGARGTEFDWKYTQKCLESNINLVIIIFLNLHIIQPILYQNYGCKIKKIVVFRSNLEFKHP